MIAVYNFVLFRHIPDATWLKSISYKFLMVHNIIPNEALAIVGPWWFYGLIMQMYVLFIPLFSFIKKYKLNGLLFVSAVSYAIMFLLYNPLLEQDIFIMANAPGHLPEFALCVYLALYPKMDFKIIYYTILISIFIF